MTGGSFHTRKQVLQAPVGFLPLQRTELRKSTDPRFPNPGSFPSRRFSRPQGLTPSETARAYSIPLPLLGFHLQSLPFDGDALAGKSFVQLVPRRLPRPEGRNGDRCHAAVGHPEGYPPFAQYERTARRTRLQPRCPSTSRQTHLRCKALMAVRTSSKPTSLQPRSASRTFLPGLLETHPKASSDPTRREPTEGPHVPKDAGSSEAQSLDQTHAAREVTCGPKGPVGRSKPRPAFFFEPCSLLQTQGLLQPQATSGEHTT